MSYQCGQTPPTSWLREFYSSFWEKHYGHPSEEHKLTSGRSQVNFQSILPLNSLSLHSDCYKEETKIDPWVELVYITEVKPPFLSHPPLPHGSSMAMFYSLQISSQTSTVLFFHLPL